MGYSGKKSILDKFEVGDIIFVKKENGAWKLKTISKSEWRYSSS